LSFDHNIRISCNDKTITGWQGYSITNDVLTPADGFSLSLELTKELWELCSLDSEIGVFIDDTQILSGFIGSRSKTSSMSGTTMVISGRDRVGRLVDESAPQFKYGGLKIKDLAQRIVGDWFGSVTLQNTKNRNLVRSTKARKSKVNREPSKDGETITTPINDSRIVVPGSLGKDFAKKVMPGQSRMQVLEEVCKELRLLAWSSANGKEIFIGLPAYEQDPQYFFTQYADPNQRTNCVITVREDIEDMYSEYTVIGANKKRATVSGEGFQQRKRLVFRDDNVKTQADALDRVERERLKRETDKLEIDITVPGHSQIIENTAPVIFAADTMASVVDELTGLSGLYYITAVTFNRSRDSGSTTDLKLVPKGTALQL